jgi:hypothetical protein
MEKFERFVQPKYDHQGRIVLKNETEMEFTDISIEEQRRYYFPLSKPFIDDEIGMVATYCLYINNPQWLHVAESGAHYILDHVGVSHYIPAKWNHLEWTAKEHEPHFIKVKLTQSKGE